MVDSTGGVPLRASLRDVAIAAGVSTATASHALSGKGRMSDATRARIRATALRLGYRPHQQAAALRRRTSNMIGFMMVPNPSSMSRRRWSERSTEQLYSLVTHAARHGFSVTVIPEGAPELVESSRIDALCFFDIERDEPALLEALRLGIPVLSNDTDDPRMHVAVNSGASGYTRETLEFLATRGSRRPAVLTSTTPTAALARAEETYAAWCADRRVPALIERISIDQDTIGPTGSLIDAGADAIIALEGDAPSILDAVRQRGLTVPDDVQVVGTATTQTLSNELSGITAVVSRTELMSVIALDAYLASPDSPRGSVMLPWELLTGRTTRP